MTNYEHQVTQHQNGTVEPTDGSKGPHSDWYSYGMQSEGQEWKNEEKKDISKELL